MTNIKPTPYVLTSKICLYLRRFNVENKRSLLKNNWTIDDFLSMKLLDASQPRLSNIHTHVYTYKIAQ